MVRFESADDSFVSWLYDYLADDAKEHRDFVRSHRIPAPLVMTAAELASFEDFPQGENQMAWVEVPDHALAAKAKAYWTAEGCFELVQIGTL